MEVKYNNDLSQHLERIKTLFSFLFSDKYGIKKTHFDRASQSFRLATPLLRLIVPYTVCFLDASVAFSVLIT